MPELRKRQMVTVYAPPGVTMITRGEHDDEVHYVASYDGSIIVPEDELEEFWAMGCRDTPEEPVQAPQTAPVRTRPPAPRLER